MTVSRQRRGHVLLIGLDRAAKRNAITPAMYAELASAYGELNDDPDLRCGVLFAHGEHFTGGIDLPQWQGVFAEGRGLDLPPQAIDPLGASEGRRVEKPIVMAVQGWCLTIGIELLLASDIRVAASDTRFAQIEIKRGIFPIGGATTRLALEIGWGNAMRWLLTGDEFDAAEAFRLGLVQELVEPGQQLDRAITIAERIAEQAPLGVFATLRSARAARLDGERAEGARLAPALAALLQTEDAREGVAAFIARRPARFTGR